MYPPKPIATHASLTFPPNRHCFLSLNDVVSLYWGLPFRPPSSSWLRLIEWAPNSVLFYYFHFKFLDKIPFIYYILPRVQIPRAIPSKSTWLRHGRVWKDHVYGPALLPGGSDHETWFQETSFATVWIPLYRTLIIDRIVFKMNIT